MTNESWNKLKIGNIADVISGYAFKSKSFSDEGVPVIKIKNIRNGFLDISKAQYIDESHTSINEKYYVRPGDLLISLTGSHITQPGSVVGRVAINRLSNKICFLNQRAGKITITEPENNDKRFLYYLLSSYEYKKSLASLATGAASQANVSPSDIESLDITIPDISEQQKISSILSAYDDMIDNNIRRIKILEELAQMIYRKWFVNFRFPGHENVKIVDSEFGPIPEGWDALKYVDLLDTYIGGDWGKDAPTGDYSSQVQIIRGTDFDSISSSGSSNLPIRYIRQTSLEKRKIKEGDIVIENSVNARSRCTGKNIVITKNTIADKKDLIAASFCKLFRPKNRVHSTIMHLHLDYLYESGKMAFYQNVAANGIGNFQAKRFVKTEHLIIPSSDKNLEKMMPILDEIINMKSNLVRKNGNLTRTRDLLLPKLISGEIDVSDLDIQKEKELA